MDDLAAIDKYRAGETEAFNHLVKKYQSQALGHAVAILGSREDALDAVQQAFLDAYRTLEKFDSSRRFYPWLYTILRNHCFNILASRKKHAAVSLDEVDILEQPKNGARSSEVALLERAMRELSSEDRELLTLKHLDGLRYEELSERLGIPSGTVMSRLYYARKRLAEKVLRIQKRVESQETYDE